MLSNLPDFLFWAIQPGLALHTSLLLRRGDSVEYSRTGKAHQQQRRTRTPHLTASERRL